MGRLKIWAPEEDLILCQVSTITKSKKWKKASEELRRSGFDRSDVECRQRFINHLDPAVRKELWSDQELEILYRKYDEYGNKWFLLQRHLPGRTQTKIKNFFYGNIRYLLKLILKFFFKRSTGFINDVKTQILLNIYEAKDAFQSDFLIQKTIKRLNYRIEKKGVQSIISQNQEIFGAFIEKFLSSQHGKSQSEEERELYQTPLQVIKIQCPPRIPATKVEVVCSVGGQCWDRAGKLQYLRQLAANHLLWHEFYNKNYLSLLKQGQDLK